MPMLERLTVQNYRCVKDVSFDARPINLLFGPNGVGKSTFLDALWFIRDCAIRGTEEAASTRHHGNSMLSDSAGSTDAFTRICIEVGIASYEVRLAYSSGRIETRVGETLKSRATKIELFERTVGSDTISLSVGGRNGVKVKLRDPAQLALNSVVLLPDGSSEASEIEALLDSMHMYVSRSINLDRLRRIGSETGVHTHVLDHWQNLWSALRNLNDRRGIDGRFEIILNYMVRAFPGIFKGLTFEQVGPDRVIGSFVERGRSVATPASGASDGHLQMLGLLTALFGANLDQSCLLLFDEPEISLHPYAIAVFAEAVQEASTRGRQIFLATHSPVLISQFEHEDIVVAERGPDQFTTLRQVSQMAELKDLLNEYALGSLYMAEEVGRQSAAETSP